MGRNLRDHILLPRIFLTRKRQDEASMSYNSIRGWWTINRLLETDNKRVYDCARFQIQLADGVAIDRMILQISAMGASILWLGGAECMHKLSLFYLLSYIMMNIVLSYTPLKH